MKQATGKMEAERCQDFLVLRLPREVAWRNYPEIRDALCRALAGAANEGRAGVVVDFSRTALLDASGLVLLARAQTRARLLDCQFRAVAPAEATEVRSALGNIGLTTLIAVYPSLAEATRDPCPPGTRTLVPDMSRVLDAIRGAYGGRRSSPLDPPVAGLVIEVAPGRTAGHATVLLRGSCDAGAVSRLGQTLTSLVDSGRRHLVIDLSDRPAIRYDTLTVLSGIRWRVTDQGGCLTIASPPAVLRAAIRREGLDSAFAPCAAAGCAEIPEA